MDKEYKETGYVDDDGTVVRATRSFEIARQDGHVTILEVHSNNDITIREIFGDLYHVLLSVRHGEIFTILDILNDPETFVFKTIGKSVVKND